MAKALTALTLNKRYEQDEALRWGMLTRSEKHHRLARNRPDRLKAAEGLDKIDGTDLIDGTDIINKGDVGNSQ